MDTKTMRAFATHVDNYRSMSKKKRNATSRYQTALEAGQMLACAPPRDKTVLMEFAKLTNSTGYMWQQLATAGVSVQDIQEYGGMRNIYEELRGRGKPKDVKVDAEPTPEPYKWTPEGEGLVRIEVPPMLVQPALQDFTFQYDPPPVPQWEHVEEDPTLQIAATLLAGLLPSNRKADHRNGTGTALVQKAIGFAKALREEYEKQEVTS